MESKKELLKWFKNNLKDNSEFTLEEFVNVYLEISNEAKKELIVELKINWHKQYDNKKVNNESFVIFEKMLSEAERHLSTFQKKSDIITDKSKSAKIDITKR